MLESKYAICGKKKSMFIRNQEVSGLLSILEVKTPLSSIPLILLFESISLK